MCERRQCCANLRYHYSIQFDGLRKNLKNHCKLTSLRHNIWTWEISCITKEDEAGFLLWETVCLYYSNLYYVNRTEFRGRAVRSVQRLDTDQKNNAWFPKTAEIPVLATTFWPTVRSTKPSILNVRKRRPFDGRNISLGMQITNDLDLEVSKRDTVIYFERSKIKDSQNMRDKRRRINLTLYTVPFPASSHPGDQFS
jgi:hypothetical protein